MAIYSAIVSERVFQNSFFVTVPHVNHNHVILLMESGKNTDICEIRENTLVKARDIRKKKYNWIVDIDLSPQTICLKYHVPTSESIYFFDIILRLTVVLNNPIKFYQSSIRNVEKYIENLVEADIREQASKFQFLEYSSLNNKLKNILEINLPDDIFQIRLDNVTVDMDDRAKERMKVMDQQDYNKREKIRQAEDAKEIKEHIDKDTGIYMEYLQGKLSPGEIQRELLKLKNAYFVDAMDKSQQMIQAIKNLNEAGIMGEKEASIAVKNILSQVNINTEVGNVEKDNRIFVEKKDTNLLENNEENNEYAPFDD